MKKNNNNKSNTNSAVALVFDRFYSRKPNAALVIAERMLLAAALSFLCINYIFSQFTMPVNAVGLSFVAAGFSVVFSLLFAVVKKRIAIPIITIIGGIVILWRFNAFWAKFSFFVDAVLLESDGNFFKTANYTIHPLSNIEKSGMFTFAYIDGVVFGSVILCVVFALITSAGVIGKPHIIPSLAAFLLLCMPSLASEKLMFGWQLIFIIALYAGLIAVGSYYRNGLPIRHAYAVGGYQRKLTMDDRRFNAALKSQSIGRRASSRGVRYSKYFSSVISAAAMFTVLGLILNVILADSAGIDYQPLYNKLQNIKLGINDAPFVNGPEADYFTSSLDSVFKNNNRLNLTAPSNSSKEIIRVTKNVSRKPLYLRGDVGVDFDGISWTSTVASEPEEWDALRDGWLPVEMSAFAYVLENWYDFGMTIGAEYTNATVEYLCETDTVFVPAYDDYFNIFQPEFNAYAGVKATQTYDVFGDYAARFKSETVVGEKMEYSAVVPLYTDASDNMDINRFRTACEVYIGYLTDEGFMDSILSESLINIGSKSWSACSYRSYVDYVNKHYRNVPPSLGAQLNKFIEQSGLDELRANNKRGYEGTLGAYSGSADVLIDRFLSAKTVSDYLKENYTYSRDVRIDRRNPVMSFLNDSKSGHCALYASAMTLILREWGIPARYCTGFAAGADQSVQTLRSRDLHAWCEVYLDELGWVTFDPTAAAVMGNGGNTSGTSDVSDTVSSGGNTSAPQSAPESASVVINNSSDTTQSVQSSDYQSSDTHESNGDFSQSDSGVSGEYGGSVAGGAGGSRSFRDFLPYLLTIFVILIAIALIVLLIRAHLNFKKRAYKQVQSLHREKNSDFVYEKLLAVLELCGFVPQNGEQPHEFFERAETALGCDIDSSYPVLESLAFGETELDASERVVLGRVFERVYRAAEDKFMLIGRIRLRCLVLRQRSERP